MRMVASVARTVGVGPAWDSFRVTRLEGETVIETEHGAAREQRAGVQVLASAARILRLLAADSSSGLTLSELVVRAGLPRTTVHRIGHALEEEGFVCVDADADSISATLLRVRDEIQIALQGA